ncbi:hypothetical protein TREES_T100012963 [Tupaia chinensis]|uniref:ATPase PAAT n=1 Tax=Tupaia chinensis TaxID=246437 RepID=L9L428_TUPCH|nr:hypothetical protein TREES_T100012963 [Tupaia chinensis]
METEDRELAGCPTLASSWNATCGALTQSLLVTRAGLGVEDSDWEELLVPPAPSQDLVILKRSLNSQDENPCFLYLMCDPKGGEEMTAVGILSSARNMEVYLGEEYCGTSRGKNVCTVLDNRTGLTSGSVTKNLKAYIDKSTQPPGEGNTTNLDECKIVPQNHSLLENDLKNAVSSFLPKKGSDNSDIPNSELLPFLQNLCSQVNLLRVGQNGKRQENTAKPHEGVVGVGMEEQPVYSYLEKLLSRNMELMEKKLMDYIDQRLYKLQEHIDDKIALLVDIMQNPNSPSTEMPLKHYDSGERLSNGER